MNQSSNKPEFAPEARCHWKAKDPFFTGDTCRHAFKTHYDADRHVDDVGIGHACGGGDDDDEDTWCGCPGFEPSPDSRRFPDYKDEQRESELYQKAMRGE